MKLFKCLRLLVFVAAMMSVSQVSAQSLHCKDTLEHRKLQQAMWESCFQDKEQVVYDACQAYLKHAKADDDLLEASTAWVCGIMYSLGRMDISSAYHIAQGLKSDIESGKYADEGRYFISNMMGHIYNTCGNIPGAEAEFLKSAEQIKGTRFERDGMAFIYLALAHVHLNNDLKQTLYWLDVTEKELMRHKDSWNFYRCLADVYAIKAIVRFKQKDYAAFRQCINKMEEAEKLNRMPSGDLFTPYARIYKTLLDKGQEAALAEAEALPNLKEQYLLKCDIYRYIGDNEKAFMTQRELMHKRDSITGVMIAENMENSEEEMALMRKSQKMAKVMNYILFGIAILALLTIVLMTRNILIRRKFNKQLMAKNKELKSAYKQVAAANEMKSEFIRNVSHEVRTPLNIITGFAQVIANPDMAESAEERKHISTMMQKSTRQVTILMDEIIGLSLIDSTEQVTKDDDTNINRMLRKLTEEYRDHATCDTEVKMETTLPDDYTLKTNENMLHRIMNCLMENAVKYTQKGSITIRTKQDDEVLKIAIEDTGSGIPEHEAEHIFDRFVKLDNFKEGIGLGLSLSRKLAQQLGGNVELDTTYKDGARFIVTLPKGNVN